MENRSRRRSQALSVQATVPGLTPAQMYSNFEEWIKMCTDNKVNATNTWNFALIDYFHEMTFLREGDSINFQKASCTLDGCVKIYTSRVDSVANETGKLLSGLADSNTHEGDDDTRQEKRTRRKTNRSEATLLKDFSSIALKKFDLDFAVDPLFKKTSADFDEGGARGLLLNHLSLDQNGKIIFDASDATIEREHDDGEGSDQQMTSIDIIDHQPQKQADEKEDEDEDEDDDNKSQDAMDKDEKMNKDMEMDEQEANNDTIDKEDPVSESMDIDPPTTIKETSPTATTQEEDETVKSESRIEIFRLKSKLPKMQLLPEFHIVPFLKGYDFFTDDNEDVAIPDLDNDDDDDAAFANDDLANNNDFNFDEDFDVDYGGDDIDPFQLDDTQLDEPQQDPLELPVAADKELDFLSALINTEEHDMFNYFDSTFVKNWAGPEHWKLRRKPAEKQQESQSATTTTTKRKPRTEETLPFQEALEKEEEDEEDEEETNNEPFEPSTKKLTLTKDALSKMTEHLLPQDIHFSSKVLLQYSLKPALLSNGRKKKRTVEEVLPADTQTNDITQSDVNFWAEQTQDYDGDDGMDDNMPADAYGSEVNIDQSKKDKNNRTSRN
ncbi:MAG: condensin complex subunit 2/barren [Benjaminiella poitrasii]|nr:MAG: condensin complex subunit 2/barren [Benjaminiella poitrasii]